MGTGDENQCCNSKEERTDIMTGQDLIDWIHENKAEDLSIYAMDDGCGLYPVNVAEIVEHDNHKYPKEYTYVVLDE